MVESSWNVMAHGDAREGKWRGNWRIEWLASTLDTTTEHDVSSITNAVAHTSTASSRMNWRPCRFKWTRPFRRKTKSGFCACANTFQTQSTHWTGGCVGRRSGMEFLRKRKIQCPNHQSAESLKWQLNPALILCYLSHSYAQYDCNSTIQRNVHSCSGAGEAWDSSVGTENTLRAGRSTNRGSNLGRNKKFFSSPKRQDRTWGLPTFLFNR